MIFARQCLLILLLIGAVFPSNQKNQAQAQTGSTQQPTQTALNPEFMGMVIRDPWYDFGTNPQYPNQPNYAFQDTMGATLAHAGVRWVRLDFHILSENVEQEIAKNDYFIREVAPKHGFKVLGLLSFDLVQGQDPRLLNTGPFTVTSKFGGGVNQYMDTWLNRALFIADRYGPQVHAYEILNEQNRLPPYTLNGPEADAIQPQIAARLMTKFYRFCKNIAPLPPNEPTHGCANTEIILGGLHPRGTSDAKGKTVMTDAEYIKAMYEDQGSFKGFWEDRLDEGNPYYPVDGIGYHPYPHEIRLSLQDVHVDRGTNRIREMLQTVGDGCKPFWVTEIGYNVGFDVDGKKGPIPQQTEGGQMEFMQDVYRSLAARQICGGQPEVARVFWFKYEDFPPAEGVNAQRWGIVRIPFTENAQCAGGACYDLTGTPAQLRAAFLAYRELAGLPVYHSYMPLASKQ